jgi:uncharacterized membrane protein YgdD (TMEM256/DUF423 family)
MESLLEFRETVLGWHFLPLGLGVALLVLYGSGLARLRCGRLVWLLGLVLFVGSLYLGLQRHEWGEVRFNGQLL